MFYLEPQEIVDLFQVVYDRNKLHHMAMVTSLWHGLRVNELITLTDKDIQGDNIYIARLKGSKSGLQAIMVMDNPLLDESPIKNLGPGRLFPFYRQRCDQIIKFYGDLAGIPRCKRHWHVFKHTTGMFVWNQTQSLGAVQEKLGHKSESSSLVYLKENDKKKGENALRNALAKL
jgi:integrase